MTVTAGSYLQPVVVAALEEPPTVGWRWRHKAHAEHVLLTIRARSSVVAPDLAMMKQGLVSPPRTSEAAVTFALRTTACRPRRETSTDGSRHALTRHLPAVNARGEVIGSITAADLLFNLGHPFAARHGALLDLRELPDLPPKRSLARDASHHEQEGFRPQKGDCARPLVYGRRGSVAGYFSRREERSPDFQDRFSRRRSD